MYLPQSWTLGKELPPAEELEPIGRVLLYLPDDGRDPNVTQGSTRTEGS